MNAVITGDIIHSTRMKEEHRQMLVNEIQQALKIWKVDFKFKSEFFRGDSFQCYLDNPKMALKVTLLLKTFIRSLNAARVFSLSATKYPANKSAVLLPANITDARIALGMGEATVKNTLSISQGTAFTLSGHLLDELKNSKQALGIATADMYNDELRTEAILLDAIISKTTALQCEVINLKLLGYNETAIATRLKIIQSAVNQRSRSGNWNAILAVVNRFEKIY